MKLKLITAALVLATSGSAQALILDGDSDNGELFMTLWSEALEISYARDLNLRMNDFLAGAALGNKWEFEADDRMKEFLNLTGGANGLLYAIGAVDTAGATATNYYRFISSASVIDLNDRLTNLSLKNLGASANPFLANINGLLYAQGGGDSLIVTDKSYLSYAGSAKWGSRWGNAANFTSTGEAGQPMGMYYLRQSTGVFAERNKPSVYEAVMYNGQPYMAHLDMDGNLTISPIPEPETYALMLAGLGLVGWMARRRKA